MNRWHRMGLDITWSLACLAIGCDFGEPETQISIVADSRDSSRFDQRPLIRLSMCGRPDLLGSAGVLRPFLDYLTAGTALRYHVVIDSDSERALGLLEERRTDIAYLDALTYIEARRQFGVVPLVRPLDADGRPVSRGAFITRRDSPIHGLRDLRGRSLALGAFHSTTSHFLARYELDQAGVSIRSLGTMERLIDDEAVVRAVLEGRFDVGAVAEKVAERFAGEGLRVIHVSREVPSAPIATHSDMPLAIRREITEALARLDPEGSRQRGSWYEDFRYGFVPAADEDYDPLRRILDHAPGCGEPCHSDVRF